MDFHIDGTGAVWRGVTSSTKTVKLGPDELYGLVRCIDGCTKILRDPFGAPTVGATESGAQVTLPPGADAFRCARGEAGTEMRGAA